MAVAAGVLAALAVVVAVLSTRGGGASARVGQNVFVTPNGLIDANNSPTVARNPTRADNMVVAHRVDLPGFSASLQVSNDGGRAWQTTALPLPPDKDRPFAADAAFAPDGTLYVSYVNLQGSGNRPDNLWVARSDDGGRSLSAPVRVAGALTFQARIAVDRQSVLHVTWLKVADVAPYAIVAYPSPIVAVHSSDGGRSFSEPVQVSDPERMLVAAGSPAVDADGNLVVLYQDYRNDNRDFRNLDGPVYEDPFALVVAVSRNGGKTFSKGVEVDAGLVPTRRFLVFLPEFPSISAGPGGKLYVAWADGRNGDLDVFVKRSGDGGTTWGRPVRVNTNRIDDGTDQYMPRVSVAPDGRVDVLFFDRRRDPSNLLMDAYLGVSDDQGRSFDQVRVSSSSFDSRVGFSANPKLEPDLGSRLGLTSTNDGAFAVWTDTRLGTEDTARQDIAAAPVTISEKRAPASASLPMASVLLVAAGLCFVAWLRSGRDRMGASAQAGGERDTRSVDE
ncbi:MAG TPA: sialidase family protein [Acidimicrobiales bacterium]|nr:sialidase family protein [Acidimicrobiales bacterium]